MMDTQCKITRQHLDRLAIVYVRQSSLAQVRGNQESTARQYGLADDAKRLGWDPGKVLVIDADLGVSGRSATGRLGFQDLVHRVCLGEVGAIFGLEISRLARCSADLQRLLEFCSITRTLVVDADGVYDLQNFNDRLLLGLKGTMSEAELHILAGRLQDSKRAAAKRGDLRCRLPVGYLYDEDGRMSSKIVTPSKGPPAKTRYSYDGAGRLVEETTRQGEHRNEKKMTYSESGTLTREETLRDGSLILSVDYTDDGRVEELYDDGQLFVKATYVGGRKVKDEFYSNGVVSRTREY